MVTQWRPARKRRALKWLLLTAMALLAATVGTVYFFPGVVIARAQRLRAWHMGLESKTVKLGKHNIHYLVGGQGKPLVLVHGLTGRGEDWFPLLPPLLESGYRIYAPDLLGFGRSSRPDVDYSIALEADILRQFMDSQGLQQSDISGWSMGGWVGLKFAAEHPERVHRLILLDSAGLNFDAANAAALRPKTVADIDRMMAVLSPHPPSVPGFYARELLRSLAREDWITERALKSMYTGRDLMDGKLETVTMPVLLLWGKQDVLTPPEIGERLQQGIAGSKLQVFDGCGHLAPVECRDRFAQAMISFLGEGR